MIEKSKIKTFLKIPFNKNTGNQLGYPDYGCEQVDNYFFDATLTFIGFSRGRSSVKVIFQDIKGIEYEMFATNFSDLVKGCLLDNGVITGEWSFCKRGQNYGIVKVI